ncbi:hypothetical protein TNIN_44061 [Trichonephila inaurata madagascariensis]|uniref:Secreted protein n=1 Tax=Trichonephila inaurata madagascariensis TaxID=2747483 RepID=A0A8X6XTH0_9ARAC|nr:hypothetical protein TNIN_44061 [Trichonephila inaurata madagascariensis]
MRSCHGRRFLLTWYLLRFSRRSIVDAASQLQRDFLPSVLMLCVETVIEYPSLKRRMNLFWASRGVTEVIKLLGSCLVVSGIEKFT